MPPPRATWAATHPRAASAPSLDLLFFPPQKGPARSLSGPKDGAAGPFSQWKLLSGAAKWSTSPSPATTAMATRRRRWVSAAGSNFPRAGSVACGRGGPVGGVGGMRWCWWGGASILRPLGADLPTPKGRICDGRWPQWRRQRLPAAVGNGGVLPAASGDDDGLLGTACQWGNSLLWCLASPSGQCGPGLGVARSGYDNRQPCRAVCGTAAMPHLQATAAGGWWTWHYLWGNSGGGGRIFRPDASSKRGAAAGR